MIQTESYIGREIQEETRGRAWNDLLRVSGIDTTQDINYQGVGKDGSAEYHKYTPEEQEKTRRHVEFNLRETLKKTGANLKDVDAVIDRGKEISLMKGRPVRIRVRL